MYKVSNFEFEKARFIGAVDRLRSAHCQGIEISGLTAYLAIEKRGLRPLLQFSYAEIYDNDHKERLVAMGHYVELAAQLSETVDQQG